MVMYSDKRKRKWDIFESFIIGAIIAAILLFAIWLFVGCSSLTSAETKDKTVTQFDIVGSLDPDSYEMEATAIINTESDGTIQRETRSRPDTDSIMDGFGVTGSLIADILGAGGLAGLLEILRRSLKNSPHGKLFGPIRNGKGDNGGNTTDGTSAA